MVKMKLTDRHLKFANAVAAGENQQKAYKDYVAIRKLNPKSLNVIASKLANRPEIAELIVKFRKDREEALIKAQSQEIAKEFNTNHLTNDQLDSYHCSIIQGMVLVEEIIPVYETTQNDAGKVLKRFVSFKSVKRPANIREKQASIDALYKRRAAYPNNYTGMFKRTIEEDSDGNQAEVTRFVMLSNGEKLILP